MYSHENSEQFGSWKDCNLPTPGTELNGKERTITSRKKCALKINLNERKDLSWLGQHKFIDLPTSVSRKTRAG